MVPFETWHAEIAADLEAARTALSAEQESLITAEAEVLAAKHERREITDAIARVGQHPTLAGALYARIREHENSLGQADGKVIRIRNEIKNLHSRIKDCEDALRQLAVMTPANEAADELPISVLA